MRANGSDAAGVGTALSAEEIGEVLSAMQVGCRAAPFPIAPNGAPKPCSTVRAGRVRSEMQREGGSPHWEGVFALALCDLSDGVPVERVRAVFLRALAEIDDAIAERQASRPAGDYMRPLGATVVTALKAEHRLELAELRAVDSKTSVAALEAVIAEADRCIAQESVLREVVERTLVLERGASRPAVGRRAGALSLA
jgi:hypothetical protein